MLQKATVDVTTAISKISYALRGTDDDAPASDSEEWDYWLSVLNDKKDELFRDVKQNWAESYDVRSIGSIAVSTAPTFDLPSDFIAPSGLYTGSGAYVVNGAQRYELELKRGNDVRLSNRQVFIVGNNPKELKFGAAIDTSDLMVGGELFVPGYYMPGDLVDPTDKLPFADPLWGVYAAAAEIAFSDVVYEDKAESLNAKANYHYEQMVQANRQGVYGSPRKLAYNVKRVGMR